MNIPLSWVSSYNGTITEFTKSLFFPSNSFGYLVCVCVFFFYFLLGSYFVLKSFTCTYKKTS